ncbi:MAG TPA: glutamate synthase subunit beta [Myxococcaceae bacterium]|nr:glutamate synthase subunit beta [Myxococcaceae bacterium]
MGKTTGFLEWQREAPPKRPKSERVHDTREFILPQPVEQSRRQAGRCMDCGIPFCHQGCPLGNLIPDFNDHVWRGRWEEAWATLSSTNDFPEFTGRLCPAPCEAACVLAIDQSPVTIEQIEKEIADRAFREGWVRPRPPASRTGKTVAVVGSGPAGLAAAAGLNRAGHTVTVYERAPAPGGLLRFGIPDFKLEKSLVERRVKLLEAEGVVFRCEVDVGRAPGFDQLAAEHDALVLALGARRPRDLPVQGRELPGVVWAMDYLEAQNRYVAGAPLPPELSACGKRVVILGGGDTGSDCLGTAHRQGAAHVEQIELLPAPPQVRAPGNWWPEWPLVFRTSSSQEEGGDREFGLSTTRLIGRNGWLAEMELARVELERDEAGRSRVIAMPGTETTRQVDLLILAMGFLGPDTAALESQLGLALDARGNVRVDGQFRTSRPGIWAVGDARRGASLIVWPIADGREAARDIDGALTGAASRLPTRGVDLPFTGT